MKTKYLLLVSALLSAATAFGQMIAIGTNTGVQTWFSGSIEGQNLFILVDNNHATTPADPLDPLITGTITSFGFNTPWSAPLDLTKIAISYQVLSATGPTNPWNLLSVADLHPTGLQLIVDLGAESDANNNANGGNPDNGVAFGEQVRFRFSFDSSYSLAPYVDGQGNSLLGAFMNQDPDGPDFFARWQQVTTGTPEEGSDATARDWPPDGYDNPQGPVPEPSTYGLLGATALLGLILVRRLRR